MNSSDRYTIERCNAKLMALYDEREELYQDIDLDGAMGKDTLALEQQLAELQHTIKELERQLHEAEGEHLTYMKEAI